jgi:membrane protein DedA with SNARE-associated domain
MVKALLGFLSGIIISVISTLGYWGLILAMAVESACIPLPSEIIMPFGGYLIVTGTFVSKYGDIAALIFVGLAGAFGCVVGSIAAYAIGIWGGRPLLDKYGKYILISRHDLDLADRWFGRYGEAAIFFSRLLPVVRTFISLPAGIARMNFPRFIFYTFIGSFPWCFGLAFIGYEFGRKATEMTQWEQMLSKKLGVWMHVLDVAILLLIVAGIVWYVRRHLRHVAKEK